MIKIFEEETKGLRKCLESGILYDLPKYFITISTDYIEIRCSKCASVCNIEFLGLDPTFNELKINCPKCKEGYTLKCEQLEDKSKNYNSP